MIKMELGIKEYLRYKFKKVDKKFASFREDLELDKTEEEIFDDLLQEGMVVGATVTADNKFLADKDGKILIL